MGRGKSYLIENKSNTFIAIIALCDTRLTPINGALASSNMGVGGTGLFPLQLFLNHCHIVIFCHNSSKYNPFFTNGYKRYIRRAPVSLKDFRLF